MHLRALDQEGGRTAAVRVTDVVEPSNAARDAVRDNGYRLHGTLADLLAARRPDGVLVAAPTGFSDYRPGRPPLISPEQGPGGEERNIHTTAVTG
jgi:hypothetical protein